MGPVAPSGDIRIVDATRTSKMEPVIEPLPYARSGGAVIGCPGQSPALNSEIDRRVIDASVTPGLGPLRPAPAGLPDPNLVPPAVAESGDPFATLRILHLLARIERGRPVRLADVVDRLNATYLDWLFPLAAVVDAALQLQANWMTDYRSRAGIVIDDGPYGPTIAIEDSSRVDPWIVRQVEREAAACRVRLLAFSRSDRSTGDG